MKVSPVWSIVRPEAIARAIAIGLLLRKPIARATIYYVSNARAIGPRRGVDWIT